MDRAGLGYGHNPTPPNLIGVTAGNFSHGYARVPRNGNSFLPSPVRAPVMRNFAQQTFANSFAPLQAPRQNSAFANLLPNFGLPQIFTFHDGSRGVAPSSSCYNL